MTRNFEDYVNLLLPHFSRFFDDEGKRLYGNRSHLQHVLNRLNEDDDTRRKAAVRAVELVASAIRNGNAAGSVAMNLGKSIGFVSGYDPQNPPPVTENGILSMGISVLHWFALEGLITMKKLKIDYSKDLQWFIMPRGEFADMCMKLASDTRHPSLTDGPFVWTMPVAMVNDNPMEMVKKSIRAKMLHNYDIEKVPAVYEVLNRIGSMEWRINDHIFNLVETATEDNPFVPGPVSIEERTEAKQSKLKLSLRASNYRDFIITNVLNNSDLTEKKMGSIATKSTKAMVAENSVDIRDITAKYDKHVSFNRVRNIAKDVLGQTLNFAYAYDSRGRIYAVQPHLQPLGADVAKALLDFNQSYPVELYDLAIATANALGNDKVTFEKRVEYVNENMDMIRRLGEDPWSHLDELVSLKLGKKEKWQALRLFNVWFKLHKHLDEGGDVSTFNTPVPIGYDGSCQGLQILSLISRDEATGPRVNVAPFYDANGAEAVGDVYGYVGSFLVEAIRALPKTKQSDTLMAFTEYLEANPAKSRTVVKRNVMTRSYACTRFGCGEQHVEDKSEYGFAEADALTGSDCFTLGACIYDLTDDKLGKASSIMKWLQEGIEFIPEDNPVVSWTLPDGFVAFTYKEKIRKTNAAGMIGKHKVCLVAHVGNGKVDAGKQKSAIAPSGVHSLDAYLLRSSIRNMPSEAPFCAVHDSFGTASWYMADLVEVVKAAYKSIGDRDMIEDMFADCFGYHRPLPEPGKLKITDLDLTDYFIS